MMNSPDLATALFVTIGISLTAFIVTGGALVGFIRSLAAESRNGELVFGRRSRIWLGILIATILLFSGVIAFIALS